MLEETGLVLGGGRVIPRGELVYRASRAGGAGGQHVNTSSTRIELLWNVRATPSLDDETRRRIELKLVTRVDKEGWIRVVSSARRSQLQNREAAEERLVALLQGALAEKKRRKATKPSRGAKEARIAEKKKRGETKKQRGERRFD